MKTREYLDTAAKIVTGQRQYDYGDKYQNHENIARLWSAYLDYNISAHDVAICMMLVKVARLKHRTTQDCYCLLYTSPSPRDAHESRMPSSA